MVDRSEAANCFYRYPFQLFKYDRFKAFVHVRLFVALEWLEINTFLSFSSFRERHYVTSRCHATKHMVSFVIRLSQKWKWTRPIDKDGRVY